MLHFRRCFRGDYLFGSITGFSAYNCFLSENGISEGTSEKVGGASMPSHVPINIQAGAQQFEYAINVECAICVMNCRH